MIAALFVPAPWPGLILLAIAVTAVAICAWQFFSRCPICEERNCDYGDYGDDEDEAGPHQPEGGHIKDEG